MSLETLGDVIRARRDELGLSDVRLAELVGVSPGTLRDWEMGRSEPTADVDKLALAAILGLGNDVFESNRPQHLTDAVPTEVDNNRPRRGRRLRLDDEATPGEEDGWRDNGESLFKSALAATIGESELVKSIRDADPIATVRDSEMVSTLKQRLVETFGPSDDFTDDMPKPILEETEDARLVRRKVDVSHSLTEDVYHEPSYVEDPDEMDHYRNRWIITAFVVIVLLMLAFWAMGQAQASLTEGWQRMFDMLNI